MMEDRRFGSFSMETHVYEEFIWKIPNFFSLPGSDAINSVLSPTFNFGNATWYLRLFQLGVRIRWQGRFTDRLVDCEIVRLSTTIPDHSVNIRFGVLKDNSEIYKDSVSNILFKHTNKKSRLNCLLNYNNFMSERNCFAPNGAVTFFCRLQNLNEKPKVDGSSQTEWTVESIGTSVQAETEVDLNILCQNLKGLLLSGGDYDVILQVKDREFRAHQCILKARSDVLSSMLTHNMLEKNSGIINIDDCDPKAFEQFLFHLYTGKVETLDRSTMLGLYYIADKYNIANLKNKCCVFIKKSLSITIVCDVIQLALNHSDTGLLSVATDYFVQNTTEIFRTVEWQCFLMEKSTYANELLIKASNKWDKLKTGKM